MSGWEIASTRSSDCCRAPAAARTPYDTSIVVEFALIRNPETGRWRRYRRPVEVVAAAAAGDVPSALSRIDEAVANSGLIAAGFVAFEAAPAFDPALRTHPPIDDLPLLCFGIFENSSREPRPRFEDLGGCSVGELAASQSEREFSRSVKRIREHIARGDTYQVNHTFRLRASFEGDPRALFLGLVRSQPTSYAAYLDLGDWVVCSASPEGFFVLEGNRLVSRPMKGTVDRGFDPGSDRARETWLARSVKNRAENAMITDMVRNDLGRVAEVGSVKVTGSFDVERHPTVFQMTSTVEATTTAPVAEIIAALFPPASVTGAPKVRTMELISRLEAGPRGVYTGAIGTIGPGRRARLSVAIRTAVVDRAAARVEYGVGSGIVWDSKAGDEYRECAAKARILSHPVPEFDLLETMLWRPGEGFVLLERHLDRLAGAAEYFGRPFNRDAIMERLETVPGTELRSCVHGEAKFVDQSCNSVTPYLAPLRVRILIDAEGAVRLEAEPVAATADPAPVRLGLAADPVKREDPLLHFKTTHRGVYDRARASRPDCDDVLLWNERGEVTESTIANLVVRIGGELVTPPVECGLLAGTFRAELLERGEIVERVVRVDELPRAESLHLVNSVQGWRDVTWIDV